MEIGILIAPQKNLSSTVSMVDRLAVDCSPDYIWVCDRLLSNFTDLSTLIAELPVSSPAVFLDPFLTISAMIKPGIRQLEFGIAVTDFIRRAPPDMARACNTISQIIGRPLNIGFGSGEAINLKPLGYGSHPKPVSLLDRELQRFAEINCTGVCRSEGYEVELGYHGSPSKIWIGGQRERMLGLTARYADGWLPAWKMPPDEYRHKKAKLEQQAAGYGRACPKAGMFAGVMMGKSRQAVLREIEQLPLLKFGALELPAELWKRWGISHPCGDDVKGTPDVVVHDIPTDKLRDLAALIPAGMLAETGFCGNVSEILDELWEYRKAGMEHLALMAPLRFDGDGNIEADESYSAFELLCEELKSW